VLGLIGAILVFIPLVSHVLYIQLYRIYIVLSRQNQQQYWGGRRYAPRHQEYFIRGEMHLRFHKLPIRIWVLGSR
jgi:hypothetical protein